MATTIAQAIVTRFDGAGLTDFTSSGGLHLDEIPPGKSLPWAVYSMMDEAPCEYTFELAYMERGGCEFAIVALTPAEAERLALLVKAAFDLCVKNTALLDITSARVIEWERTGYRISVEPLDDPNQKQVAIASISYGYRVQRSLPTS